MKQKPKMAWKVIVVVVIAGGLGLFIAKEKPVWELKGTYEEGDYAACLKLLSQIPEGSYAHSRTQPTRWLVLEQLAIDETDSGGDLDAALQLLAQIPPEAANTSSARSQEEKIRAMQNAALQRQQQAARLNVIGRAIAQAYEKIDRDVEATAMAMAWRRIKPGTLLALTDQLPIFDTVTPTTAYDATRANASLQRGDVINIQETAVAFRTTAWYRVIANGSRKGWVHETDLLDQMPPAHFDRVSQLTASERDARREQFLMDYAKETSMAMDELLKAYQAYLRASPSNTE